MKTYYTYLSSPLGPILVARTEQGITRINFQSGDPHIDPDPAWMRDDAAFDDIANQLEEYFSGKRTTFELPLAPEGTPFQLDVWQALQTVPYGETSTYGQIANSLGKPTHSRAVGAANGRNPLPVVVPCHRIIGSNGQLTGYYGGLHIKEALLELEGVIPAKQGTLF